MNPSDAFCKHCSKLRRHQRHPLRLERKRILRKYFLCALAHWAVLILNLQCRGEIFLWMVGRPRYTNSLIEFCEFGGTKKMHRMGSPQ